MTESDAAPSDGGGVAESTADVLLTRRAALSTACAVPNRSRRATSVTMALVCGAILNVAALALFVTVLLGGWCWLVIAFTAGTVVLAAATRHVIRAINPRPPEA